MNVDYRQFTDRLDLLRRLEVAVDDREKINLDTSVIALVYELDKILFIIRIDSKYNVGRTVFIENL